MIFLVTKYIIPEATLTAIFKRELASMEGLALKNLSKPPPATYSVQRYVSLSMYIYIQIYELI